MCVHSFVQQRVRARRAPGRWRKTPPKGASRFLTDTSCPRSALTPARCDLSMPVLCGKPCQPRLSFGLKDLPGRRSQGLLSLLIQEAEDSPWEGPGRDAAKWERLSQLEAENFTQQTPRALAHGLCPDLPGHYSLHSSRNHHPK